MPQSRQVLAVKFPERRSTHAGTWAPLYMEPLVGSGERICIGVAAVDGASAIVAPVDNLERFECVYGKPAKSFAWAATLALTDAEQVLSQGGLEALPAWSARIDGLSVGDARRGAGTGLSDLANIGLQQVSALVSTLSPDFMVAASAPLDEVTAGKLDVQVRQHVTSKQPKLREYFGRTYRPSQSARPLRFGFVGRKVIANFSQLNARTTSAIGTHVDKAKARLWDLHQLNEGVLAEAYPLRTRALSFELLVNRPSSAASREGVADPARLRRSIKAAEEELEAEADKFDIRFRPMSSPQKIAAYLLEKEAA